MAEPSLVSVVIPTSNQGPFIAEAVQSALDQTWPRVEVIVIDDGSTDDTREQLRRFGGVVQVHAQENRGAQAARNHGVGLARGDYVAMLDSDDVWLPDKLRRDVECLAAEPDLGLVCGRMEVIDPDGRRTGPEKPRQPPGETVDEVLMRGSALFSSFTFPRAVFEEVGGCDESIHRFSDLDFVFSVLEKHPIRVFSEPLVLYRDHPGNMSKDVWGIYEGRYRLARKWSRRFTDPRRRRTCLRHVRDCARRLRSGYLRRGSPLRALRFGVVELWTGLRLLAPGPG